MREVETGDVVVRLRAPHAFHSLHASQDLRLFALQSARTVALLGAPLVVEDTLGDLVAIAPNGMYC